MRKSRAKTPHAPKSISNRPRNGARLPGRIILPKTHSFGVNVALHEFSCALERCRPAVQNQFGSEVCTREPDAGDNDRDQDIVHVYAFGSNTRFGRKIIDWALHTPVRIAADF
jgi:hypothetical protein